MEFSTRSIARLAVATSLLVGLAAVILNWEPLARPLHIDPDAGALEQIFGVRPVTTAIRIGTVMLVSYVAGSVLALGLEGRLLIKAGPAGAEAEPAGALSQVERNSRDLAERIVELEGSLREAWGMIDEIEEAVWDPEGD